MLLRLDQLSLRHALFSLLGGRCALRVAQSEDVLVGAGVFSQHGAFLLEEVSISTLFMVSVDHIVNKFLLLEIVALVRYTQARNKKSVRPSAD